MKISVAGEGTEEIVLVTEDISFVKFQQTSYNFFTVDIGLRGVGIVEVEFSDEERAYKTYMRLHNCIEDR